MSFSDAKNLEMAFGALHYTRQAKVLARLIHEETIHVRGAYSENPSDAASLYGSSEFIHRLSGIIMVILCDDGALDIPLLIVMIVDALGPRGQNHLDRFCEWVSQEAIKQ